jgi:hypothetical protein
MEQSRLVDLLDALVEQWCARRALAPLRCLLPAWPGPLAHSDQWRDLWRALQDVRGLGADALTPEETALHAEAVRLVNQSPRAVGQSPYDR